MKQTILCLLILASTPLFAIDELLICTGDSTRQNVLNYIEGAFEKEMGIKIVYPFESSEAGAAVSFKGLIEGKCETASSAGDYDNWVEIAQKAKLTFNKGDFAARVIGRDLIKFAVHPKNGTAKITLATLADILSGKIKNWKDVGGPSAAVHIYIANKKPATTKNVQGIVLKNGNFAADTIYRDTWTEAIAEVKKALGGIVFLSGKVESGDLKILETDEPVGRPITMITKGKPSEKMAKLYEFINKRGPDLIK